MKAKIKAIDEAQKKIEEEKQDIVKEKEL